MKVLNRLLPLGLLILTVSACSNPGADYDAQEVINSANEQWNAAFNDKDLDALTELYASQATLSPGDGNVLNGQQEIAALFQGFNWSADVEGENGETMTFNGVLMTVLQQNDQDEWEVVSHIWNMAE